MHMHVSSETLVRDMRNTDRILVGKPEGKIPLGKSRCRWEDNIKIDLKDIGCADVVLIHLTRGRV